MSAEEDQRASDCEARAVRDAVEPIVHFMEDNQLKQVVVRFNGTEVEVDVTHDFSG